MRLQELFEDPDFGYTKFNNKENELSQCRFKIKTIDGQRPEYGFKIIAILNNKEIGEITLTFNHCYNTHGKCYASNDAVYVTGSGIDDKWKGTGLGQLLYDNAISCSKKLHKKFFRSDASLSNDAHSAWKRLSKRYPVVQKKTDRPNYPYFYEIDLRKVSANIQESPDFGYSQYNNKEADLKNVKFEIWDRDYYFVVNGRLGNTPVAFGKFIISSNNQTVRVADLQIDGLVIKQWRGTGLGQLIYDYAIQYAKKKGCEYFISDSEWHLSSDAHKAWDRLAKRYNVVSINSISSKLKSPSHSVYAIDLRKVPANIQESPDFGYKHFVDRDDEITNLKWKIKYEGRDGFIITAVKDFYEEPSVSIHGNYEAILIARPTDFTIIRNGESFQQTGNGIQVSYAALSKQSKDYWHSTGLGQMLYDKAIQYAKKCGYDYFQSDSQLSVYARKAWQKLAKRYPVKKVKEDGINVFRIDLSKVTLKKSVMKEEPDFGYKNFVNRDEDIAKLKWVVELSKIDNKVDAIKIRAVDPTKDYTECRSIHGPYEGLIAGSKVEGNALQVKLSRITSFSGFERHWESTGLGQMLYDRFIDAAKKYGFDAVLSDYTLSVPARKAWAKLSQRYPVEEVKKNGINVFRIDLK